MSTSGITLAASVAVFAVLWGVLKVGADEPGLLAPLTIRATFVLAAFFGVLFGVAVFEIGRAIRSLKR